MLKQIPALAALIISLAAASSQAATVTLNGDNFSFTFDDSTLFGSAGVVGDSIYFLPTNFGAQATNLDGAVITSDVLNIQIQVLDGFSYEIGSISFVEVGDYELFGSSAEVQANGRLQVTSNTKVGPNPLLIPGLPDVALNTSQIFAAGNMDTVGALTEWSAIAAVDLTAIAGWGSDTSIVVQVQNNLRAVTTELGDSATIQKKAQLIGLSVQPSEVPVPGAAWLFGSALVGLIGLHRKK